jgi:L-amino acid N-acyltransferase YncA
MDKPIIIREGTEADLPELLSIYNDIILHTTAVYDYEPHTLDMRRQWWETKKQQGLPVFVATEKRK